MPLAVTQLAQVALTTTDTVIMGRLGTGTLAAGGLAIVLFNQLRTMGVGLITAVGNQVAAAVARAELAGGGAGAGVEEVRDLVRASMAMATAAGAAGALLMVGLSQLLGVLGQDQVVVDGAQPMVLALAPGLLPCLWFQALRQYTVGMRRPRAIMRITTASIAVNLVLDLALARGTWILPELGLTGIGLATTFVYAMSFSALYVAVRRDPDLAPGVALKPWQAPLPVLRRQVRLGLPVAATYGAEAGFFFVVALVMGSFGPAALAAHTAVNQCIYIVLQVTIGLSHGASILVSREVAGRRPGQADRVARVALFDGLAVMALVGVAYLIVPNWVLGAFFEASSRDQAAFVIAGQLLTVAAVLQFFDCAQNIGVGLLRGLDDTAGGFRMAMIGYWSVGLPAAWLIGRAAGLGPVGVWLGLSLGLAATATLMLRRFWRGVGRLETRPGTAATSGPSGPATAVPSNLG